MKEKIKHFLLLTVSTLIMAVGTYFFKFTNNFTFAELQALQFWLLIKHPFRPVTFLLL